MIGNIEKNRWCCFCKHWYDPLNLALTPRPGKGMYVVDHRAVRKCTAYNYNTKALSTCAKFERKI